MPPRNHPLGQRRSAEEVPLNAGSVGALHSRLVAMLDQHGLPSTFDGLPNEIAIRSRSPRTRRRVITAATPRSDSVRRSRPSCRHSRRSARVSAARRARRISGGAVRSGCEPLSRDGRRRRTRAECRACPIGSRAKPIATRWQAAASGRGGSPRRRLLLQLHLSRAGRVSGREGRARPLDGELRQEYVLPYEEVRAAADPGRMLGEFLQSAYEAGADLAPNGIVSRSSGARRALAGHERERRDRLPVFLDGQHPPCGRHRAIGAFQPRADRAGRTDRRRRRVRQVQSIGIGDAARVA